MFQSEWKSYDGLQGVSEQLTRVMLEAEWKERYGEHKYEEPGTINLCGMDITFVAFLIVNGPMRGHVVYLDYDGCDAPMWPKGSSDFLDSLISSAHFLNSGSWIDAKNGSAALGRVLNF